MTTVLHSSQLPLQTARILLFYRLNLKLIISRQPRQLLSVSHKTLSESRRLCV